MTEPYGSGNAADPVTSPGRREKAMGYRNVWELQIKTNGGIVKRYIGKSKLITPYINECLRLPYVQDVTIRKLSNEERKQIGFNLITG